MLKFYKCPVHSAPTGMPLLHTIKFRTCEDIETEFPLNQFPPPQTLWHRYKKIRGIEDASEGLVLQPYHVDGSGKEPRYYQIEAINRVVEAVANGQKRVLLVMATGTGKTYTTFQIIWRLWKAKAVRRVLFLVDRNILADQTLVNDFKPFGSVMAKVKNRTIDPSYEFTLPSIKPLPVRMKRIKFLNRYPVISST